MIRLRLWALVAGALALAACALTPPANRGYILCNEAGNETGCGEPVNITVE